MYIVPIMRGRGGLLLVILFCVGALQLILFRKSKFYHQKDNTIAPTSRNNTNDYDDDATTASKLQNDIRILARIKELEERLKEYESEFQDNTPSSTNADAKSITQEDAPSYLNWQWDNSQEVAPQNWTFQTTKSLFCNKTVDNINSQSGRNFTASLPSNFQYNPTEHDAPKIIIHYHMQHNAGTTYFDWVKDYSPCALRSCWQSAKHCMISMNEEVEADNIRNNYRKYGVQYVSYEVMLPPRFPMPFVSDTAREGLFFTTIVRDPFNRLLTAYKRRGFHITNKETDKKRITPWMRAGYHTSGLHTAFFVDAQNKHDVDPNPYAPDNLNVRWLSGTVDASISRDHVNIAKCRLQLFDLVIADQLYDHAVKKVMCPLNNWKGHASCDDPISKEEHISNNADILNGTADPILLGAWIERLRPSFELYDYAKILSWKQLQERGVADLPELSEIPSYIETLAKYTNLTFTDAHFNEMERVSLENEEHFQPPAEFCSRMKQVWMSNPDGKYLVF